MIDDIVVIERQLDEQQYLIKDNVEVYYLGVEGQLQVEIVGYDGGVAKGFVDGQVTVKRYDSEDEEFSGV